MIDESSKTSPLQDTFPEPTRWQGQGRFSSSTCLQDNFSVDCVWGFFSSLKPPPSSSLTLSAKREAKRRRSFFVSSTVRTGLSKWTKTVDCFESVSVMREIDTPDSVFTFILLRKLKETIKQKTVEFGLVEDIQFVRVSKKIYRRRLDFSLSNLCGKNATHVERTLAERGDTH